MYHLNFGKNLANLLGFFFNWIDPIFEVGHEHNSAFMVTAWNPLMVYLVDLAHYSFWFNKVVSLCQHDKHRKLSGDTNTPQLSFFNMILPAVSRTKKVDSNTRYSAVFPSPTRLKIIGLVQDSIWWGYYHDKICKTLSSKD